MKSYAYLDKTGILHGTTEERLLGGEYVKKWIETDLPFKNGYYYTKDGKQVVMYSLDEIHLDGGRTDPNPVDPGVVPEYVELYKKLLAIQ